MKTIYQPTEEELVELGFFKERSEYFQMYQDYSSEYEEYLYIRTYCDKYGNTVFFLVFYGGKWILKGQDSHEKVFFPPSKQSIVDLIELFNK